MNFVDNTPRHIIVTCGRCLKILKKNRKNQAENWYLVSRDAEDGGRSTSYEGCEDDRIVLKIRRGGNYFEISGFRCGG